MQKTVVLGAGGHAKVVIELLRDGGVYRPTACVAANATIRSVQGVPVVGDDSCLPELLQQGMDYAIVAVGDNRLRAVLIDMVRHLGFRLANAISRSAVVSQSVRLGEGLAVMAGAHLGTNVHVEDGVIVNSNASVDHDGVLRACCHIGPGATLAGGVRVGHQAFIATGASVIPDRRIGDRTVVGAGAVVVRDVPADLVVWGVPAKVHPRRVRGTAAA